MKKLITLLSLITLILVVSFSFSASADEGKVVIDNVVYQLTSEKYGKLDYGEHYAVIDFFDDESLAETTTKINIVDEIDGIEVVAIDTNIDDCEDPSGPYYTETYPSVKKITIPSTIKYIGDYAFSFFPSVEKLQLPTELEIIEIGAFYRMTSLKSITIPENITYISENLFDSCSSLEKVAFCGNIRSIHNRAFMGCEKLTSVNLPSSLKSINECAFYGTAFKKIVIPEMTVLGRYEDDCFGHCKSLEKIVFEDTGDEQPKEIKIDDNFWGCTNVKGIYIKTVPTERISFANDFAKGLFPNLTDVYFAGSEETWNKLTNDNTRAQLENNGVEVHFYYRHTHNFSRSGKVDCKNGGTYTYTCECGDSFKQKVSKSEAEHNYGKWTVTKKPTYTVAGTKTRTCSVCKKTEKRAVAKTKLYVPYMTGLNGIKGTDITTDSITLKWETIEGANGYRVYMKNEKGKYVKIASPKNTDTYTVTGLDKGKSYMFKIKPYHKDSEGNVVFAETYSAKTIYTLGTSPTNLVATSTEEGVIKLTWDSSGENIQYYIYYGTSKEMVEQQDKSSVTSVTGKTTKSFKNLTSGTTYYFLVKARGVEGESLTNIAEVVVK